MGANEESQAGCLEEACVIYGKEREVVARSFATSSQLDPASLPYRRLHGDWSDLLGLGWSGCPLTVDWLTGSRPVTRSALALQKRWWPACQPNQPMTKCFSAYRLVMTWCRPRFSNLRPAGGALCQPVLSFIHGGKRPIQRARHATPAHPIVWILDLRSGCT